MKTAPRLFQILFFSALLWLNALPAAAFDKAGIQVSASGNIDALPDFIHVYINIEKVGKTRPEAKSQVDAITGKVLEAARKLQIEEKNIRASDIFTQPEYEWKGNKHFHTGERVTRSVHIKLYQLDNYSSLAENIMKLDITNMQQQGFGYDNIDEHQNKALMLALDKARTKAVKIAEKINRKLGSVYQVTESGEYFQPAQPFRMERMTAMAEDASGAAPLEIKPQTVTATVNVIYLLE